MVGYDGNLYVDVEEKRHNTKFLNYLRKINGRCNIKLYRGKERGKSFKFQRLPLIP